jgi:deoxyguanosine kinase
LGRRRGARWGPRTIDLDLLLYAEQVLRTPSLVLPHPRMAWRRFVLEPAAEVAPQMIHPTTGWAIARLLQHLDTAAPYVAIAGPIGVGKTRLAEAVARRTGATLVREELDLAQLEAFYQDPAGTGWATEVQLLHQRARLLAGGTSPWSNRPRLVVSDFWFDQSLAFADVWLGRDQAAAFVGQFDEARRGVVRPKLVVLLDAPAERLLRHIAQRGRPGEQRLGIERLEQLRSVLQARASATDVGPMMHLAEEDLEQRVGEVLGAVEAM